MVSLVSLVYYFIEITSAMKTVLFIVVVVISISGLT